LKQDSDSTFEVKLKNLQLATGLEPDLLLAQQVIKVIMKHILTGNLQILGANDRLIGFIGERQDERQDRGKNLLFFDLKMHENEPRLNSGVYQLDQVPLPSLITLIYLLSLSHYL